MQEPIKSGDICRVIDGVLGKDSPNIGKQVTVHNLRGEHSVHGRIWLCTGNDLVSEYGGKGSHSQFAAGWLEKLPPQPLDQIERAWRRAEVF